MIHVNPDSRIIFVRGTARMKAIEDAVLEATGQKSWRNRRDWVMVAVPDEDSKIISTGMPFDPPSDRSEVGFRVPGHIKKNSK